ncbi:MAG: prephenate dehydrogenase [Bacteriovorax sp.]|nr:prephenate dehydrogenase [Bacteriovorax sp.]
MKLAVVGLGLIGGSMALDLKKCGYVSEVFGVDQSIENQQSALELKLVDKIVTLEGACKQSDIIIIATPVSSVITLLPRILDLINEHQTVLDVGSTKNLIIECVRNHKYRANFVATHPMAGTEFSGPSAAQEGLFCGKATVICDSLENHPDHLKKVNDMYLALKMRVIEMKSIDHDLHVAYVSHLSHISSFVLANTVLDKEKDASAIFNLASAGFESTVRLAKSSPEMWAPIFDQNQKNIVEALGDYIDRLKLFHESLKAHDYDQTKKYMYQSNEIKRILSQIQKTKEKE